MFFAISPALASPLPLMSAYRKASKGSPNPGISPVVQVPPRAYSEPVKRWVPARHWVPPVECGNLKAWTH
jgi:hypothetical protein